MRATPFLVPVLIAVLAAPAAAFYGSKPGPGAADAVAADPRSAADRDYREAFDHVTKGTRALERGKAESAKRSFRHALELGRAVVELDSTRYDAWNLVGFSARQLGDYPQSFAAYRVALRLEPGYAPAREYFGELLLETGDFDGALEQLSWLRRIGDAAALADLQQAVDRWRTAHPGATGQANAGR